MNDLRAKALKLRIEGKSYNEIRVELRIAKSTLSLWLRDVVLSEAAKKRLQSRVRQGVVNGLIKRNKLQTHLARQRAIRIRTSAARKLPQLDTTALVLIGVSLYWAEGYKRPIRRDGKERTSHIISLVNADAGMIQVFIKFLIEILKVKEEDIMATMRLYPHISEKTALQYWKSITKLSDKNFRNTTFLVSRSSSGKRPFNRLPYGTLQVAVYNTEKYHYLMGLLEEMKKRL